MSFLDRIRDKFKQFRDRRKENYLIKKGTDEEVVEALPREKDNIRIDIAKVVDSMDNPEQMAKVIQRNSRELVAQDSVEALQQLDDKAVVSFIEGNRSTLQQTGKMVTAIEAIDDDSLMLEAVADNLDSLTVGQTAAVLDSSKTEKEKKKIESKKMKIASKAMLDNMVKFGYVSQVDIDRLTHSFESEQSKLDVIDLCLTTINAYGINAKKNVNSNTKVKFVYDMLRTTNILYEDKITFVQHFADDGVLSDEEHRKLTNQLKADKAKNDEAEKGIEK